MLCLHPVSVAICPSHSFESMLHIFVHIINLDFRCFLLVLVALSAILLILEMFLVILIGAHMFSVVHVQKSSQTVFIFPHCSSNFLQIYIVFCSVFKTVAAHPS